MPQPAQAAFDPDNLVPTHTYAPLCIAQTINTASRVCQTDNGAVSVYIQGTVTNNMESRIRDSLDNSYDPTQSLTVTCASPPVYSGAGETDIIYQQGALPSATAAGIYGCDDDVDNSLHSCDQGYVRFITNDVYGRRLLACHETGHAVGLTHGDAAYPITANSSTKLGCMRAPFDPSQYLLGSNNVDQINAVCQ